MKISIQAVESDAAEKEILILPTVVNLVWS